MNKSMTRYSAGCGIIITALAGTAAAQLCSQEWAPLAGGGLNDQVRALAVFDGDLYAGGFFTAAGNGPAKQIARWDGQAGGWSPLGAGVGNWAAYALAVFDDGNGPALYAAGLFSTSLGGPGNHIAKWDGQGGVWLPLGEGTNGTIYTLAVFDDGGGPALYAGGGFNTAGGVPANRIARWDSQGGWSPLGAGVDNEVHALAVFDDGGGGGPALYAGGGFTGANGVPGSASRVARWGGGAWSAVGSGVDDFVLALTVFDDGSGPALYAGGLFGTVWSAAQRVGRWDPASQSWLPLGAGMNQKVFALASFDDGGSTGAALYVGGEFTTAGGVPANGIARWEPISQSWLPLGAGVSGAPFGASSVAALAVYDGGGGRAALYAGGNFTAAGGEPADRIARWCVAAPCYANCDGSTIEPILNVDDFTCFINEFAPAQSLPHEQQIEHYANCDGSTIAPVLTVDDFTCFINEFAAGCP